MFRRPLVRWGLAAALVALFGACSDGGSPEDLAIEAVEDFREAVYSGDIDAAMEMLDPSLATPRDRQFWEFFHTLSTYGVETDFTDCVAEDGSVVCRGVHKDAVAQALELPDGTYYFPYDGEKLRWLPPDPVTLASGETDSPAQFQKGVYYDYLTGYYPGEFGALCSPASYDPSSVRVIKGLAFTAECAELIGPLDQEMADWVRAGRPVP